MKETCIAGRLEVASGDRAAHRQVSDRRRTRASEKVAVGHLRWPTFLCFLNCAGRTGVFVLSCGWRVLLFCLSSSGDLAGSSLSLSEKCQRWNNVHVHPGILLADIARTLFWTRIQFLVIQFAHQKKKTCSNEKCSTKGLTGSRVRGAQADVNEIGATSNSFMDG